MEVVNVELGARAYPIYVGAGCLRELGARLAETRCGERVAVVTNSTIADLYLEPRSPRWARRVRSAQSIQIPDGEEHKNLAWLAFVYDKLIDAGIERGGAVVALGGGVVGDLAGFRRRDVPARDSVRAGADHAARAGRRGASAARPASTTPPART